MIYYAVINNTTARVRSTQEMDNALAAGASIYIRRASGLEKIATPEDGFYIDQPIFTALGDFFTSGDTNGA